MHLNQVFVYLLLGIISGAAGAPVSSNVIASSELTTGITQSSYARGANVESGSDLDIRTIGALSHPTQIAVPVDSHSVMEARTEDISKGWEEVHHPGQEIHHPGQAPGHPTESTAAAYPEPPRRILPVYSHAVSEQKLKSPDWKDSLVSLLSYTWVGIKTGRIGDNKVSSMDMLIHHEAVDLIDQAATYEWGLTNYLINRHDPYMYPAAAHPDTMNTTEFKFLLKLEYDYGGKGKNYCEGRVKGEPEDGCIGIIRWGKDESGKSRISELRNKDGVVTQIPPI